MRKWSVVLVPVVLSACGSRAPMDFSGPAPAPVTATFDCVNREINQMGYTVTTAERDSGLLRAERRNQADIGSRIMGGKDTFDEITVSIIRGEPNTMRITASSSTVEARERIPGDPSRQAQRDARQLLATCRTAA